MALTPEADVPEIFSPLSNFADITIAQWLKALANNPETLINRLFHIKGLELATGSGNPDLARKIAAEMLLKIDPVMERFSKNDPVKVFPDGELRPAFHEDSALRRKHVMVIQSFAPAWEEGDRGINDQLIELLLTIHAAKLGSASEVTAVLPYCPYARSDKKDLPMVSIGARLIMDLIKVAGADRVVATDIHKDQIAGFFDGPFDVIYSSEFFIAIVRERLNLSNLVLVSADGGGEKMVRAWSKRLLGHPNIGVVSKSRASDNCESESFSYQGPDLTKMTALFVDDLIAGGGTAVDASIEVKCSGAKEIIFIAPHALFLEDALQNIKKSPINQIWTTNTIRQRLDVYNPEVTGGKIIIEDIAPFLADKLIRVHTGKSMEID